LAKADQIALLVARLRETGQRLRLLTGGEIDSVADHHGRTFLLPHAQSEVRDVELAKQAAILGALPANIALLDTRGVIIAVNEAWRKFGRANAAHGPGHGEGANYLEICDAARGSDAAEARRAAEGIRAVMAGRTAVYALDYRCDAPGEARWFHLTVTPLASGQSAGAVVMHLDVTAQKLAEEQLHESERRFSDLLDNVELVAVMLDRDARLAYCNGYFLRLTGWRHEEVIGRDWFEIFMPPALGDMRRVFAALLAGEPGARHVDHALLTRAGARRLVRWNNSLLKAGDGKVTGVASIGEDITDHARNVSSLKRLNRVHALLSGINTLIVRVHDRDELFRETCRIAVSRGDFVVARVLALDAQGQVRIAATSERDARPYQRLLDDYNGDPAHCQNLVALALRSGQPQVSNDVASDTRIPDRVALTRGGTYALALLPIIVDQRVAGAVVLRAREAGSFNDAEMQLLQELVANLAFALEQVDKDERLARMTRVNQTLGGINALIVRVSDRDELYRGACRIAVETGGFKLAWLAVVDEHAQRLRMVAWEGAGQGFVEQMPLSLIESDGDDFGLGGRAVREKKPMMVEDIQRELKVRLRQPAAARGLQSVAMLPLVVVDKAVGVLALYAGETGFFTSTEMKLLANLAGDVAFAIDHLGKQDRIDYLAYYDDLTGLANRTLFLERVAQYLRSAAANGHGMALFLVDVERFKNVNDDLGRPAGDALLQQLARWLTGTVGDVNLLARYGADHFAVVLPMVKAGGNVVHLLEKAMAALREHPFRLNNVEFRIAARTGAALFPRDGANADTLFRHAEAALKQAKSAGERYLFYAPAMTAKTAGKLTLESQLREALERDEFVLHYQPKVALATGLMTGAEALIRWNDPRTGLVAPGRFIPVLEETGLIHDVGRWALRKAVEDYLRWRKAGLAAVRVAVNVSPLQLRNRSFSTEIAQVVGVDPWAAAGLALEITESLIMENLEHSIASLQAVRALGVTIAIDDFGTGFSSLSYLARLPVDTLKIDCSFVSAMTASPEGMALVSTIITLAHSLRLVAVAEGVETEEQSTTLRLLRCDEMQGFLYSKPLPVDEFEKRFLSAAR
jgi:diguanylate cyclase (GGDEF)-like protein/PAS domain S-box-containing protein